MGMPKETSKNRILVSNSMTVTTEQKWVRPKKIEEGEGSSIPWRAGGSVLVEDDLHSPMEREREVYVYLVPQ
jgi:hypothetical protein